MKSVIFLYRSSKTQHLNAYPGGVVQHHRKALKEGGMVYVLLPPDAQRHAVRDATDILGITTGRCEAAYLAVRCPPTHSGMPHEMPPICRVSLVVPRERGIACDTALKVRASSPGEGIALLSIVARSCYELLRLATAYFPETAREARKLLFDTVVWYYPKGLIGS
jgi:hypothetical protein